MISVFRPSQEEEESSACGKAFESGGVGPKPSARGFEEAFTSYSEPDHVDGVTSAIDGPPIILSASDADESGKVLALTLTIVSMNHTPLHNNAKTVFVGVGENRSEAGFIIETVRVFEGK